MSLDDPHTKMCTAISMAVGTIASYDWPEDWPDLLPLLLKMINDHTNMNAGKSLFGSCLTSSVLTPLFYVFGYQLC